MKRIFFFPFFFMVLAASAQQSRWNLQQCIDTALERNFDVRQRGLQVETAQVNYKQATANRIPSLSGSIDHGIQQGRSIDPFTNAYVNQQINYASYALGGGVNLFNGGSLRNSIKQYAYAANAARMDQQQKKDEVTLDIILAYLQVLNNEDLLAISKAQVAVTQQQVTRLEKLNAEGAISPPILYDLRGQLKGEEVNVVTSVNAVQTAKLNLLQLMNLPYDSSMTLTRDGMESTIQRYGATADRVYENALDRLALVKAATLRKQSAEYAVKYARGLFYPSFSLNGGLNSNYSSLAHRDNLVGSSDVATDAYVLLNGAKSPVMAKQNNYASEKIHYADQVGNNISSYVGVTMRVPILNNLQTRNRVKLARIEVRNASLVEENTKLQLRQSIDQAYLNMTNALDRYNVVQEQVAAYAESFRAAEVRFNAGAGTSVDYILAKGRLDAANLNLVVARYDYILRTKVLDYFNGNQ